MDRGIEQVPPFSIFSRRQGSALHCALCCDEKSQRQARTQLGLPLAPKRPRTMTHDYTLFAAHELFVAN